MLLPLQVRQVDFLALGSLSQLLVLEHVAQGPYSAVRIQVSAASGVLSSGVPVVMSVAHGALETACSFVVRGGTTTTVTLDLNLSLSISNTSLGWVFAPVFGPTEIG